MSTDDEDGFDLEDLNLDEWVDDLDDNAEAVSAPMPQRTEARPLYEPPSPDEFPPARPAPRAGSPELPRPRGGGGGPPPPPAASAS